MFGLRGVGGEAKWAVKGHDGYRTRKGKERKRKRRKRRKRKESERDRYLKGVAKGAREWIVSEDERELGVVLPDFKKAKICSHMRR